MPLENFPLVEEIVTDMQAANPGLTTDEALEDIRTSFDAFGPYQYAKAHGFLVNNSGEEFAIQFMSAYNDIRPGTY